MTSGRYAEKFGGGGVEGKIAVTLRAVVIVTTHAPVPAQSPLQPPKVKLRLGVAVSVTTAP
jgi:hypothetical protein